MNCYRYKIEHDYGFAPNPFHGTLSLATCKGPIRQNKNLKIGDWIVGFGSKSMKNDGYLIYAMRVDEIITFDQYWKDQRFQCKKPIINGTLVQMYGDNVYHTDKTEKPARVYRQEKSAHSNEDWTVNIGHYEQDTRTDRVLLSNRFYYFGDHCIQIPSEFSYVRLRKKDTRGNMTYKDLSGQDKKIQAFVDWLDATYGQGIHGDPCNWKEFNLPKLDIYEDK